MAIIKFMYDNLWDDGTLTPSSEAAGFPAANTQHRWKTRCWRSTSDTDESIENDLASPQNIKAFIIENHNFTATATLRIQGNDVDDNWGEAGSVDVLLPITAGTIIYTWSSNQFFQYWRVFIDDGDNDDYVKIGRIYLGPFFEPTRTYATHTVGFIDPSGIKQSTGGQYSANEKTHYKTISYGFIGITEADFASFETVYDKVGLSKNYFICEDSAGASAYAITYYVRNTSKWEFPLIKAGVTYRNGNVTVETLR